MKLLIIISFFLVTSFSFSQSLDVRAGYYPYWKQTTNVNFSNYNYLYFAFIYANPDGSLKFLGSGEASFNVFKKATNNIDSKRLISIGGTNIEPMADDSIARKKFAKELRLFCKEHDFDGIDMDWESIQNKKDMDNYTTLMKDIRSEIDTTKLEFVATVMSGNYWMQWYEDEALNQADFLQIMVYDQTGTWEASPYGNHSSMDHFKQAENYWVNRGFSRSKLVMGLPYYGYKFKDVSGGLAQTVTYSEIMEKFPNASTSDNLLIDNSGHYFFNGLDLITQKIDYTKEKGFKGVMVWELTQDNPQSPKSLDKAFSSLLTSNKEFESNTNLIVYPNPVSTFLTIKVAKKEILIISIRTVNGKEVLIKKNTNVVDFSTLPIGLYILHVSMKDGSSHYKKIIHDH